MADRYLLRRAFGEANEITAAEALTYFEAAKADQLADLTGTLEDGVYFFRTTDDGLQAVRWHVRPIQS